MTDTGKLIVAIDYDGTFTAAALAFRAVIALLLGYGIVVICVTNRNKPTGHFSVQLESITGVPVVYAGAKSKRQAALDAGYQVDIWCDDMPATIDEDAMQKAIIGGAK